MGYWLNGSTGGGVSGRWDMSPRDQYRYRCPQEGCAMTMSRPTDEGAAPWCRVPGHPRMVEVAR